MCSHEKKHSKPCGNNEGAARVKCFLKNKKTEIEEKNMLFFFKGKNNMYKCLINTNLMHKVARKTDLWKKKYE